MAREMRLQKQYALMAAKLLLHKMLQEMEGYAEISIRRPPPPLNGLVLMQLRAQYTATRVPPRRHRIDVQVQDLSQAAQPVSITHVS